MKATSWADQQAASIRQNRGGIPTSGAPVAAAARLADLFPELTRQQLGAVVLAVGKVMDDAWGIFTEDGQDSKDLAALLCCLVDTTGEYLYAPPGGGS